MQQWNISNNHASLCVVLGLLNQWWHSQLMGPLNGCFCLLQRWAWEEQCVQWWLFKPSKGSMRWSWHHFQKECLTMSWLCTPRCVKFTWSVLRRHLSSAAPIVVTWSFISVHHLRLQVSFVCCNALYIHLKHSDLFPQRIRNLVRVSFVDSLCGCVRPTECLHCR